MWSAVNAGLPESPIVSALAIDPTTPSRLYAGTGGGMVDLGTLFSTFQTRPALSLVSPRLVRPYLARREDRPLHEGQIVFPADIRQRDGIAPGQQLEIERLDRGEYRLVRREPPPHEGLVDWLLACPEKGFFVPLESESTDSL